MYISPTTYEKEEFTMKLGAQFYSIRDYCQDAEGLRNAFRLVKEIGYEAVQISGISPTITAEDIAACVKEFDLPVPLTHSNPNRVIEDTDALIAEHKLFGATEIGIGGLGRIPDVETARAKFDALREATKKINAAGLTFAFHNHYWEYHDIGGTTMYEMMVNDYPEFNFVQDVCWTAYAGLDPVKIINDLKGRIINIHFKDRTEMTEAGKLCPCGEGVLDFKVLYDACVATNVKNVFVEQDNAPDCGDSMEQMAISFKHRAPNFGK